jgi:hypothetical protein
LRTLVVSDLHLGATSGADLLRRPELREPLVAAVADGIDRFVVLGDGVELRELPMRAATERFEPLLREVGEALGPQGEIVLLGGNHDHALMTAWTDAHLLQDPPHRMRLANRIEPDEAGPLGRRLAAVAGPASLTFSYPGIWLRDDVYAVHGHYTDVHTRVPTYERLAAGTMARFIAAVPGPGATPDDYEAVLAPLYAWMNAVAQRSSEHVVRAGSRSSAQAWEILAGMGRERHPVRSAVLHAGFATAVRTLNALGLGPLRPALSGEALRQGYLEAMHEVVDRLGIRARHVLFGHTHRSGPWPRDDQREWQRPGGPALMNTGSWVYQPHFLSGEPYDSPYWPGTAILVTDDGPPQLLKLLGERGHAELAPPKRLGPATVPAPA